MIRLDDLLRDLLDGITTIPAEHVALSDVTIAQIRGRRLAAPVHATLDLPRVDVSAMDGWAVRSADLTTATPAAPVALRVVGDAPAGAAAEERPLAPGTALRIATGAPIPAGADAVVVVEATTLVDPRGGAAPLERSPSALPHEIWFAAAVRPGAAIRRCGEDVLRGAQLLPAGATLDPAAIGVLAGSGAMTVQLAARPRVVIVSSGDEIGAGAAAGVAIPDSNGPMLEALLTAAGAQVVERLRLRDDASGTRAALSAAADSCDVLVTSGGVSVGAHDHIGVALATMFETLVRQVAIQPGKPLFVGRRHEGARTVWALGLPGNPVSAFVTGTLVAVPLVQALSGFVEPPQRLRGRLAKALSSPAGRRSFPRLLAERGDRGEVKRGADDALLVAPIDEQGSHQASALARCDYLGDIPEECEWLDAGAEIALIALPRAARSIER